MGDPAVLETPSEAAALVEGPPHLCQVASLTARRALLCLFPNQPPFKSAALAAPRAA